MNTDYKNDFDYLFSILKKTPDKELVYQSLQRTILSDETMSEREKTSKLTALTEAYEAVKNGDPGKY